MNKFLRRSILFGVLATMLGFSLLMVKTVFHRYPTTEEIRSHFSSLPETKVISIDDRQGDIGYFGLTRETPTGSEQFFIETYPQWVSPAQAYDWGAAGY